MKDVIEVFSSLVLVNILYLLSFYLTALATAPGQLAASIQQKQRKLTQYHKYDNIILGL